MARLLNFRRPILASATVAVLMMSRDFGWGQTYTLSKPPCPFDAVVCPTFHYTDRKDTPNGTAFVIEDSGRRLLVTAFHVLNIPASRERREITSVDLFDSIKRTTLRGHAGRALLSTGRIGDARDVSTDCAIFENPKTISGGALHLAENDVARGDIVWIAGKSWDSPVPDYVPVRVVAIRDKSVIVQLSAPKELEGFSGAPVLDQSGSVVGVTLMEATNGKPYAILMRLPDLRARIDNAERAAGARKIPAS